MIITNTASGLINSGRLCLNSHSIIGITKKIINVSAICLSLGVFSAANAQLPPTQNYNGMEYITGGFGIDESSAIKEAMPNYSLVLTFASTDKGRAVYVSKVQVVVRDSIDSTVLNVESQGPFVLANLPDGNYKVFATYRNITKSDTVNVINGKGARVVFDWPYEHAEPKIIEPAQEPSTTGSEKQSEFTPGFIPGLGVNPRLGQ